MSWTNSSTFSHLRGAEAEGDAAVVREFRGVVDEVVDDLLEPRRVGDYRCVRLRHVEPQTDAFRHAEPLSLINIRQQSVQRVLPEMEFHGVRFDLRKVENIIDQLEQKLIIRLDDLDIFTDLIRLFRHRNQIREADNRVQGRSYLMAHIG